jgi:hypothetical protein
MDPTYIVQDRKKWRALVNTIIKLGFPQNVGNVLAGSETISFSRSILARQIS